jgi:RNA polymerase sigma-70 factor (ECF subfamily)
VDATSDSSLQTRRSLLSRLRDVEDAGSWQTFFDLYWRLLYNVARRAGLGEADAQDVVQDTLLAVSREMPGFRYDPARGSFKQWLSSIARRRVMDHLRKLYRQPLPAGMSPDTLEREGAPVSVRDDFGELWGQEWEEAVLKAAISEVRSHANPKHFQVFDYCVLKEWPVAKVAATLEMNAAQVYLARHRVSQAVKRAARRINEEWSTGRLA